MFWSYGIWDNLGHEKCWKMLSISWTLGFYVFKSDTPTQIGGTNAIAKSEHKFQIRIFKEFDKKIL